MIMNKKVIALIPARGGSKSIPYKNIKFLNGKPLIKWTIEIALKMKEIDKVIVSTDDDAIASVAQKSGAEVLKRPPELAQDNSLSIDTVKHALNTFKKAGEHYDIMFYLEPTSPLRSIDDLLTCLQLLINNEQGFTSVATFSKAELNPHRAWKINYQNKPELFIDGANPFLPRQKLPQAYQLNGAVYVFYTNTINENSTIFLNEDTGAVIIPHERAVDIDREIDFLVAEQIMKRSLNNEKHI
ncbi:acylneuraminate cytidylyltransferase [Bacillus cereus]|nr:acylneuraminate cytidylyltransferase [Bacillus cereus]